MKVSVKITMYKVYNIRAIFILLYFLWLYVVLVTCFTDAQLDTKQSVTPKIILDDRLYIKRMRNNTRFRTVGKLVVPNPKKTNNTKMKMLNKKKDKNCTGKSKGLLRGKSTVNEIYSSTMGTPAPFKSILRNRGNQWPKYVPRLRDRVLLDTRRVTKMNINMNMMQLDDTSPFLQDSTLPTIQSYPGTYDENINEILSPYTIKSQMMRIGEKFKNANLTMEVVGRTLEYNDILLLKFTQLKRYGRFRADDTKYVDSADEKKIIFIVHGLSVMGMISLDCLVEEREFVRLVSYYLNHLDKYDIFLLPLANPDGFGYKMEMWNKNLSPQDACPGVSLDRNFDVGWNVSKVISSCSQQYPGTAPFSEPETRAIRDIIHRYSHKIIAFIHVHAGTYTPRAFKGDAVLYPKGYTDSQTDDDKYIDLKGEIDETIRKASFQVFTVTVETLYNWYGKVTGSSVDYASTVYGIPYAMEFVMQLYDNIDSQGAEIPIAEQPSYHVLGEVWNKVIDVVANNIWNKMQSNEV